METENDEKKDEKAENDEDDVEEDEFFIKWKGISAEFMVFIKSEF